MNITTYTDGVQQHIHTTRELKLEIIDVKNFAGNLSLATVVKWQT